MLVLPIPQPIAYAYGCNGMMYDNMLTIRLMNTVPSTIPNRYTIIKPFISSESILYLFAITAICGSLHIELAMPIDFLLKPNSIATGSAISTHIISPSSSSMISGPVWYRRCMFAPLIMASFATSGHNMMINMAVAVCDSFLPIHFMAFDVYAMIDSASEKTSGSMIIVIVLNIENLITPIYVDIRNIIRTVMCSL